MNLRGLTQLSLVLLTAAVVFSGCKEEKKQRKYKQLEGTVASIDTETGEVAMLWYSKKRSMTKRLEGLVTEDTEILINGSVARLEDIRPDEHVRVIGYIEGEGTDLRLVATRVEVKREAGAWSPASGATTSTQPAE